MHAPGLIAMALLATASPRVPLAPAVLDVSPLSTETAPTRSETLWIFDADFEDLIGDNAGWVAEDRSGTLAVPNYWHKDTIRINGFAHLGDSTWWCGRYVPCWRQPRGYGNNWLCSFSREFPLGAWSGPGDVVSFEWDQRFAMEKDYDYGYVDISTNAGASWSTLATFTNPGFMNTAGVSQDWDSPAYGHRVLGMNAYAGRDVVLRFRFESDGAYSCQDQYNNPPFNSCLDGAWQLDNLIWKVNGEVAWLDDCEAPGDNGWNHAAIPAVGQTGVTFRRGQFGIDFWTNRPPMPGEPPVGTWMYAAVDTVTSRMVDGQRAYLRAPAIDVGGAAASIIGQWWLWADCPQETHDYFGFIPYSTQELDCLWEPFEDPFGMCSVFWYYTSSPGWRNAHVTSEWSTCVDDRWFGPVWGLGNYDPPAPGVEHWAGLFLDRVRFGFVVPTEVPGEDVAQGGLSAVAPNPSKGLTRITYSLSSPAAVTVAVHDLLGRVIRTLVDGLVEAGEHQVIWDGLTNSGARAASGVYFVKLRDERGAAGEAKLVLLR